MLEYAKTIDSVVITSMPRSMFDPMPEVKVRLKGETEYKSLFSFYPDEISFTAGEFLGLTLAQAMDLKWIKDKQFLTT